MIKVAVSKSLGLKIDDVAIVGAGSLPKTSSGKLQRRKTASQYADGSLGREGSRAMGRNATRATIARHITVSFFARFRHQAKKLIVLPGFARPSRWIQTEDRQ